MVKIEWSAKAEDDLNEIIEYIAQDSIEFAISFYEQIKKKVENLIRFPRIGRKVPEYNDSNIRELIFKNYRLIYKIIDDKIQIIRLIHGSRNLNL
ncbi:MAG: type II toxin-antitoxin system RelE/ParE family toxin [Promethearchaeota archaeon]